MRKHFMIATSLCSLLTVSGFADEAPVIGAVNFSECISDSKAGKKEQENMETLRKQMSSLIETSEKELREISAKFEDTEYLDSLSPKAEEELKVKYQALQEDLGRYQQQFYQVLNHANYQMVQKMSSTIAAASEIIAQEKNLDYVLNREACFYIRPDLDVTNLVVAEMDKTFDQTVKNSSDQNLDDFQLDAMNETPFDQAD
ncbi:MAG TPA: OmpH family outer membrane protein [Chlamydiales bacterium]|nr:OmpH family outer membrane protein [Chlamydiales bacterium]